MSYKQTVPQVYGYGYRSDEEIDIDVWYMEKVPQLDRGTVIGMWINDMQHYESLHPTLEWLIVELNMSGDVPADMVKIYWDWCEEKSIPGQDRALAGCFYRFMVQNGYKAIAKHIWVRGSEPEWINDIPF